MTPQQFSIMFAVNGVGLIIVSQVVALLVEKLHRHILLIILTIIQVVGVAFNYPDTYIPFTTLVLLIAFFLNVCPCDVNWTTWFHNGYGRTNRWQW